MTTVARVHGIYTAAHGAARREGRIDEDELRRYVDWLIDHGVHGLYPNGSTGEFTRFTAEERRRIIEIVCDQTARPRARAGRRGRGQRRRETHRRLRGLCTLRRPGRRDRLAVLLPAQPRVGVRLLPRDRAGQPDRRDALQHPDVRQPDRRADDPAAGRVPADRRDQGLVRRPGVHDADDRGGAADPARLHLPHRLGGGAGADAAGRLRRRHERHQRRRPRDHAQALRPDRRPGRSTRP